MGQISWIKLKTEMFSDEKIRLIESMPEADAILIIWIKLLIQAGKSNANGFIFLAENIPFSAEMLATLFNRPLTVVRLALKTLHDFNMISIDKKGLIYIENWDKHQNIEGMEKVREQNRLRVQQFRNKRKQLNQAENKQLVMGCNVTVTEQNKNKNENKSKEIKNNYSLENIPLNLNGELFLKTKFFFVTKSLIKELKENHSINLNDDDLKSEFFKM
jgi:predicted phage replisome organizer